MDEPVAVILHVDDNEAHRYTIGRRLRRAGFIVQEASSGLSGIELAQNKPDLIVLDVRLPDINGFEVCRRLKQNPETSSIPILHLSAHQVGSHDIVHGLEIGADGYLTEPIDPEELVATIKALLRIRESEDRARVLAEKWQTTFNAIQDGICLIEPDGTVTQCNSAMVRLTGKLPADIIGSGYFRLLDSCLGPVAADTFPNFTQLMKRQETEIVTSSAYYCLACDPIFDSAHELSAVVTILKDVTAEKNAVLALERNAQELARSNTELEHYAHVASHDLKEPLRAISNYVSLLGRNYDSVLDATGRKYMGFITDGARRMNALINDLLIFSSVGNQEVRIKPTDCNQVFDGVLNDLQAAIHESRAQCYRSELPTLYFDPNQMTQLFQNLISNALKFRSEKPPVIAVSAQVQGNRCIFSVRDNGIGIAPEHQERVFVLFKRLHSSEQYPGTGIGLAICKKIVDRAGGKIWCESQPGGGTTFSFEILYRSANQLTNPAGHAKMAEPSRILLN